jgi:tRNA (guanine37-N1)-methyltransferase
VQFEVFTLFPEVFDPYLNSSILERARQRGFVEVNLHNLRDWALDRHKMTDDVPYGGGGGMIMKPEPIFQAVEGVLGAPPSCPVILLTPQGRPFSQKIARELATHKRLALISGRYEGVDERVRLHLVDEELSIGDYILTGGELAAMVLIDALTRLIPGVLGDPDATHKDSFSAGRLEYPHYTRPANFRGWEVPEILRSGDHGRVGRWRREQALLRTWLRRPDLLAGVDLTPEDEAFLASLDQHGQASDE